MPSEKASATSEPRHVATDLFLQGRLEEASRLLSETISQSESADLWNDWAVVQLSLVERAFRRALQLEPSLAGTAANLGVLLFSTGKRAEAAGLLEQALASATGPALAHIQTLLSLCSSNGNGMSLNKLSCCSGKLPLLQRGQKIGRPRGNEFHQAWRCKACAYMFFDTPKLDFLANYYQNEYPNSASSWYNADTDYEEHRCEGRAQDVLHYVKKYVGCTHPFIHECGCSFGGTVAKLRSLGFKATGTDLNALAIREGSKRGNHWIFAESEENFFRRQESEFHAIYLYHALEHMPSPVDFLKDVRCAVEKSGIVLIAVPNAVNYHSLSKSFTENSWFAYPDHLHYFSPGALLCLAGAAGYAVLEVETRMVASNQADAEALLPFKPDSHEWRLEERLIQQAFMGQELRFVLTPLGSNVEERFAAQIRNTRAICENAREQEVRMLEFCAQ
jgi:2-polyprenyl-3-methyl-5-hydroxy-6-metoxy-1,4-benzoquinol methylase